MSQHVVAVCECVQISMVLHVVVQHAIVRVHACACVCVCVMSMCADEHGRDSCDMRALNLCYVSVVFVGA